MTGRRRLKILANYLCSGAVDEDKFDMINWASCAVGEGTRLATLGKEGLKLEKGYSELIPEYNGWKCFSACEHFFGLERSLANKFFGPSRRRATTVGRQILNYLNK